MGSLPFLVISGGQPGVAQASLQAAMELGIDVSGFALRGHLAEDGLNTVPKRFRLVELNTADPLVQNEDNVRHSDATLILTRSMESPESKLTRRFCARHSKPILALSLDAFEKGTVVEYGALFVETNRAQVLHCAGDREASSPGIYHESFALFKAIFMQVRKNSESEIGAGAKRRSYGFAEGASTAFWRSRLTEQYP